MMVQLTQNSTCWVLYDGMFIQGIVQQNQPMIIKNNFGQVQDSKNVYPRGEVNYEDLDDMIDLNPLNEAQIVDALQYRFQQQYFQILAGSQLLHINPINSDLSKVQLIQQNAAIIFQQMQEKPQSIVFIGESGAGKTKCCQQFMQYFGKNLSQRLNAATQIIEAFGNAKTQKNSNSTRFSNIIKLHFDKELRGANFNVIAFEKSRIQGGDKNFNVLYQFLHHQQISLFNINPAQQFNILPNFQQSSQEAQNWNQTLEALKLYFINTDAISNILASIIKLGNLQFDDQENGCTITDQKSVQQICQMLGIPEKELIRCLCSKSRQIVKNEIVDTPLSRIECINQQQIVIKQLYERLFTFLVENINLKLASSAKHTINLVDFGGFEVNNVNSFEQLTINYIYEKLENFYIQETFINESMQHQNPITFTNNQLILDALEKPPLGIMNILDDSCAVAGTDETFLNKIKNAYLNHPIVTFQKNQPVFKIRHLVREVEYNVIGFRIKNKDEQNKQFAILLQKSKNQYISTIYQQQSINKYVCATNRSEIQNMIQTLKDSQTFFVRCIKPNEQLIQGQFNQSYVLNQIKHLQLLESLQNLKEGFAYKKTYQQFYQELFQNSHKGDAKKAVVDLITNNFAFPEEQVFFGATMIFFKLDAYKIIKQEMQKLQDVKNKAASKLQNAWICYKNAMIFREFQCRVKYIQAHIRGFLERQRYRQILQATVFIQFRVREFLKRLKYLKFLEAAKVVQTYFKRINAIKLMIVQEQSVIKIQRFIRLKQSHQEERKHQEIKQIITKITDTTWKVIIFRAATRIQKMWRGYLVRLIYEEQIEQIKLAGFYVVGNRAATTIQKYVKRDIARYNFLRLRQAAQYIQGWIRSKWLSNLFQRIRYATIIIQRGYRKYYSQYRQQRKLQDQVLKPLEVELNRLREQEFMNLHDSFIEQLLESEQENIPGKKIDLFSQVIDLDILSDVSEIYDTLWTSLYKRCFKECYERQNYISTIEIGECHAYATTLQNKIYSWGLSDQLQQGQLKHNANKINTIQFQFKIKALKSGANHGLILSTDNILYSTDEKLQLLKDIKLFDVYNDDNIAVDENNLIYIWKRKNKKPIELKTWTTFIRMSQLQQKIQVHQISHGLQFFIVLSNNGLMFSMGENTVGELGINKSHSINELTLIELQDKIAEVHCGMKHSIARSTLGKVYTWGWGQMGQLGLGSQRDEFYPRIVHFDTKVLQVMAGHKQSIVITDSRKVFWWGTNSCLQYQLKPVEYMTNYPAVRVLCSWSRTLSVAYITYAKSYKCLESNVKLKNKIMNQMVSKWSENDIFSIDPPYCESLANYFGQMKKPQQKLNIKFASKIEHQQLMKQLQQSPFNLLDDVKDSSCFFSFKNESNNQIQKQLLEHSENTDVINMKPFADNANKLKLLKQVKKYKNESQLQDILKQSELIDILQFIN